VLCQGLREEMVRRGIAPEKLTVIPNGVDVDSFQKCDPDSDLAVRWGLTGKRVVAFLGSFFRYEGLDLLIEAIALIVRQDPRVVLLLVGGGIAEFDLKAQVRRLQLDSHVIMPGSVAPERIPGVYALVDVLAYPRHSLRLTELVTPLKPLEAMAMGKAMTDPANGIEGSSIVTAMCRNGTDFGVRVSGTGERWYTAPVEMPTGLYFPGYSEKDANPDMGDSAIVETVGLGGFAMATATAVAGFVGAGSASEAANFTKAMYEITVARNPDWTMPNLDYAGVPTGIDIRKVLQTGTAPVINTGIAHKQPGVGQVGAGVVRAPLACFERGLEGLAETLG